MLLGTMLAQHGSPSRASLTLLVTTEIEGREAVVADGQLLGGGVCGRLQDGDTVVAQGRYRGAFRGTGRTLHAQFVHVWTLRAGRVTHFQQYTDTAQFARVMGTADAPVAAPAVVPGVSGASAPGVSTPA